MYLENPVAVIVAHAERSLDLSDDAPPPSALAAVVDPPTFHHRDVDWGRIGGISSHHWTAELRTSAAVNSMADWIATAAPLPELADYHVSFLHPYDGWSEVTTLYAVPNFDAIRTALQATEDELPVAVEPKAFRAYATLKANVAMRLMFALDVDLHYDQITVLGGVPV